MSPLPPSPSPPPTLALRWVGTALVCAGVVLAGVVVARDAGEGWVGPWMGASAGGLLVALGVLAPDALVALAGLLGLGGWVFYLGALLASVKFASEILVRG